MAGWVCAALAWVWLGVCVFVLPGCGSAPKYERAKDTTSNYLGDGISPIKWNKSKLLFRVVGGPPNPLGSELRQRIVQSVGSWKAVVHGVYTLDEAQGEQKHDITIRFVKPSELGSHVLDLGDSTYGNSSTKNVLIQGVEYIESADVRLSTVLWVQFLRIGRVVPHEMGHVLGIRGHPKKAIGSVMNSPIPKNIYYPQQIDYNTFHLMHSP